MSRYIVYTKIFQWITVNESSFIPNYVTEFFKMFTDNAPYINSDIDYIELENIKDYALSINKNLTINITPINSGTISLVFKGTYEGEEIAIKVLRRNINEKILSAVSNIKFILQLLSMIPFINQFALSQTFDDISDTLLEQTDFIKELNNLKLIHISLKNYGLAKTTVPIEELCSKKSICMTFIKGLTVYDIPDKNRDFYTEAYIKLTSHMNYKKQVFHLDLHPGNILFVEESDKIKICLLDAGMITKLSNYETEFMYEISKAICTDSDFTNVYNILYEHSDKLFIFEGVKDILLRRLKKHMSKNDLFTDKNPSKLAADLSSLLRFSKNNNITICKGFNRLFLGFISFLGTFSLLDKNKQVFVNIKKYLDKN